ncbi:MAG: ATP-binding cassette domain-containing protein [Erythrobacter sp.]|nr:ATP-binding cassette domain-containing protein [Erythrobacter sp.]
MHLNVRDVSLAYGERRILCAVAFDLAPGEHALLLGPSGSGKSSLLNIICGLQAPDSGAVTLGAFEASGVRGDAARRRMGIVFQTLRLVSALDVRANLLLAQRLQCGATRPALVEATLERLGIAHRAHARPFELSQGEAQRAAIARALVVEPAILIADEPTSALDRANTETVAQLLIESAREAGASLLVATHDDRIAPHFERTLVLEEGSLHDSTRKGAPAA